MKFILALILLLQDPSADKLIDDLRSGDVDTRARARIQLKKLGMAAVPALEAATRDSDIELSESSKAILKEIRVAISADAVKDILKLGREKHDNKDYDGAIAEFDKALELHPRSIDALLARGVSRQAAQKREPAMADLNKAIELAPTRADAFRIRAQVRVAQRDIFGASNDYAEALELNPKMAEAWCGRGYTKQMRGDIPGAMADYDKALALKPDLGDVYANRGQLHSWQRDFNAAIKDCARAVELDPKNSQAWVTLGWSKSNLTEFESAVGDYTKALELDPNNAVLWNSRGWTRINTGDLDGAIADCTKAIELDARPAISFMNRGLAKQGKGDYDAAIADYDRAIQMQPGYGDAFCARASSKKAKGQLKEALQDCDKAVEVSPGGWCTFNRGCIRQEMGDLSGALQDFQVSVGRDVMLSDYAWCRIFLIRTRQGEGVAAKAELAAYCKSRPPKGTSGWLDKVLAHLMGDLDENTLLEAAKGSVGKLCEATFYAGEARLVSGDTAGARPLLKQCVDTHQRAYLEWRTAEAELEMLKKEK
ncbi:MAG TPA: tetratricopeptide repeat protein [Planctomycetota bacterium]|nr:tetratricopeptide repeat protein [Planctomycetota bacterium]